jgi:ribosomal protein S18 acetylase RimI-like enzyme
MAEVRIRAAGVSDVPTLIRHRRMMWWDMGRRDKKALRLMEIAANEYFQAAVAEGSYVGFLAENASGAVIGGGGIVVSAWPGVLGQRQPRRAMILNIYVQPEHRRQGIARALMEKMIVWCKENQFISVGLHASNQGRGLYEKLGFKPTTEMRLELK